MKVGLSVKPKTELNEKIFGLIDKGLIDNFLVMTVGRRPNMIIMYLISLEPGFGGQKFMADMMPKV